jgi:hypothetical protein
VCASASEEPPEPRSGSITSSSTSSPDDVSPEADVPGTVGGTVAGIVAGADPDTAAVRTASTSVIPHRASHRVAIVTRSSAAFTSARNDASTDEVPADSPARAVRSASRSVAASHS